MTCYPIQGDDGNVSGFLCTGRGDWRVRTRQFCPFCSMDKDDCPRGLYSLVFSGYCGEDRICGRCGYEGGTDDDRPIRPMVGQEVIKAEENISLVASYADPQCWECHDTGYMEGSTRDPDDSICKCSAGMAIRKDQT